MKVDVMHETHFPMEVHGHREGQSYRVVRCLECGVIAGMKLAAAPCTAEDDGDE